MAEDHAGAATTDGAEKLRIASRNLTDYTREVADDITDVRDDITGQIVGMVHERLENLAKVFGQVAKSKSPLEAAQLYSEYLFDSMKTSAEQIGELGRSISRVNMRTWSPLFTPPRSDRNGSAPEHP